jgi:hypothetical protein
MLAVSSWTDFARDAPALADAGRRRLVGADGVAIGFLGTVTAGGEPRMAPVCPIFCGDHLYLSVGAHTPKVTDLCDRHSFVLHAFLGPNDEEFQVTGTATLVLQATERSAVHRAIPFKAFNTDDPVFRLSIDRALWVHWERVGEPGTRPIRKHWRAPGRGPRVT